MIKTIDWSLAGDFGIDGNTPLHPDTKETAGQNIDLFYAALNRYLSVDRNINPTRDCIEDVFYLPYLKSVSDWLYSDRSAALSTFIFKRLAWAAGKVCRARKIKNPNYEAINYHALRLDGVTIHDSDNDYKTVGDVIKDTSIDIADEIDKRMLLNDIEKYMERREKIIDEKYHSSINKWRIYRIFVFECGGNMKLLRERLAKMPGYDKLKNIEISHSISYCRAQLKEDYKGYEQLI